MPKPSRRALYPLKYLLAAATLVAVDQLLKFAVIRFWPDLAHLNSVGSFGVNIGGLNYLNFSFFSFIIALILVFVLWKKNDLRLPLTFICSGALGNLIDRIARGAVVDFIDFKIWPSFNFADALISIGLIWLIVVLFIRPLSSQRS